MSPSTCAVKLHAAENEHSRAFIFEIGGIAHLKTGNRSHGLECGTRRVRSAGRPVEKRLRGIVQMPGIDLSRKHRDELVRIEPGRTGEGQYRPVARIKHDARPAHARQLGFGDALYVGINGKFEIGASARLRNDPFAFGKPARIDEQSLLSRDTAQESIVIQLKAASAAKLHLPEIEALVALLASCVVAPDVSDKMAGKRAVGIGAIFGLQNREPQILVLLFGEARQLLLAQIAPDDKRHRERLVHMAPYRADRQRRRPTHDFGHIRHCAGDSQLSSLPGALAECGCVAYN